MNRAERRRQARERCRLPEYFGTDLCCMCGGIIEFCPCTAEMAIAHAERFHDLSEIGTGQVRFAARLQDPDTVIHAAMEDSGKTACGMDTDFDMVFASHPNMANCPNCQKTNL